MIRTDRRSMMIRMASAVTAMACLPLGALAQETPVARPEIKALVDAERKLVLAAMDRDGIEGVAVCFIHDGAPVWVEGFGVTDKTSKRPVSPETIFSIQSTSKNITAVSVMIAVQRGILDLDKPIAAYLPDFSVFSRFEPMPQEKITLRLLLSHRAGLTHEAPVGNNYDPTFRNFEAHVRSISATWLRYPVGERYRYSNLGFDLAGYILQTQCGMPFAEWVRTVVFEPLGMADSTVSADVYARRVNRALGHDKDRPTIPLITPLIPSGGVYTSARDMAAYSRFQLGRGRADGKVILQENLWDEMHGFALGGDYGLGIIREEMRYGETPIRMLSHKGGGFGFGSVFEYCPEAGLAWAALFNRPADSAYGFGQGLVNAALTRRYGSRKPRPAARDLAVIELPQDRLQSFVGTYLGRNALAKIEVRDGALEIRQGSTVGAMRFLSPAATFLAKPDGGAMTYDYCTRRNDEPAHFECFVGEESLDYNDGPSEAPGPDDPRWAPWVGQYRLYQWGVVSDNVSIQRKNGFLYLNQTRLVVEPEIGLFFTSDGEAVDFRRATPTWKNLRLEKIV